MQISVGIQKKLKMHAVSVTPHARSTALAAFKGKYISIKNISVPELSYPTTKKIYKFKGAT
jgi:hypothetical protein